MVELSKTNRITVGVIFFLLIILLGFIFINPPKYSFKEPLKEVLTDIKSDNYKYSPEALAQVVLDKNTNVLLVDVRSQYEYDKSHLPEAHNIPTESLLEDGNYKFFKDAAKGGKQVVLYGKTANDASAPFMILHQMGFDNLAYTQAGYDYFEGKDLNEVAQKTFEAIDEKPVTDFAQFIEDARKKAEDNANYKVDKTTQKTTKTPVQVKVHTNTAVEEDEGC